MNQYWGEKKILFVVVVIVLFFLKTVHILQKFHLPNSIPRRLLLS